MTVHSHAHDHADATLLPQLLALDAVIHASLTDQAINIASGHVTDVESIIDTGAGTGAGTFALAAKYPSSQIVAVDADNGMLMEVRRRADAQEISSRIRTVQADIAAEAFDAGIADLIWSSNAMHEVSDPSAAYASALRSLRRGGVLAIVEMDAPPLVLPLQYAALETALRAGSGADGAAPEWSAAITDAGFHLVDTQSIGSDQILPANGPGGAYAALELRRLAQHALPSLTTDAVAELRGLVLDLTGSHEVLDHVHIRGTRTVWVARRP
jgi:SAM-dependent methyltransferase